MTTLLKRKKSLVVVKGGISLSVAYQTKVLADGALTYWPLSEISGTTAFDKAGTRHGTIGAGVTLGTAGKRNAKAMFFNGTATGIITLPVIPSIAAGHSFEVWFFIPDIQANNALTITRDGFSSGCFNVQVAPTINPFSSICSYPGIINFTGSSNLLINTWYHIVYTYDGTTCRSYINGVFGTQASASIVDTSTTTSLTIGYSSGFGGRTITLQDIAIYLRALTPTEIAAHYAIQ